MRKLILTIAAALLAIAASTATVSAHSGGTDRNGCHAGSKPYHCH